jgi:hypothetical protein
MHPKKVIAELINDDRILLAELKEKNMPEQMTIILEDRIKTREYFLYGINMPHAINFIFGENKLNELNHIKNDVYLIETGRLIYDGYYFHDADSYYFYEENGVGPGYNEENMIYEAVHLYGELDSKWFEWYYNDKPIEDDIIPYDDINDAIFEMLNVNNIIAYKSKNGVNSFVAIYKNYNLEYEYEIY